jgi:hypothetical protein
VGKGRLQVPAAVLLSLAGFLAGTFFASDYGGMGVLTVLAFYFLRERSWRNMALQMLILAIINILFLGGFGYGFTVDLFGHRLELPMQGFAVFALIPIWLYHGRQGYHSKPFQYFCYGFYPAHMLILSLISNFT